MRPYQMNAFLRIVSISLALGSAKTSVATGLESESVLIPMPIAEAADGSTSWDQTNTRAFSIHGGEIAVKNAANETTVEEPRLAPLPEGMSAESTETLETSSLSLWPSWLDNDGFCTSCGEYGCSCGQANHGVFGNIFNRRHGCWVARFDSLVLWRNAPQSRPLFTNGGTTALDADQLESDVLAAPRISLFHVNKCGYGAEFTYIYAGNFYGQQSRSVDGYAAPGIYDIDTPPPAFATATLLGQLQSFEANSRTPVAAGNIQFISGFRWIQWQEDLRIAATSTVAATENYQTECFNDLYGGQIGFDTLLYRSNGGARLEGLVKAGVYYNHAVQHSATNTSQLSAEGSPASGAFAGEVGLTGVVPLSRNLDFRVGYFGLWLESIAQPSRQLSGQRLPPASPPGASLSTIGNVVIQGVSLGLEGRW